MKVQRILFPTDFSPASEVALDHALFQAGVYNAELHIVHAVTWNDQEKLSLARLPDADSIMMHMQNVARVQLHETLERHRDKPFRIREKCLIGPRASESILKYIEEQEIDLMVMGTHGRQGLYYFLMGSVAEEIVRLSTCPVITVREKGPHAQLAPVRKVLVPIDFSDASRRALAHARWEAETHDAELLVMHVVQSVDFPSNGPEAGFTFLREWLPKIKKEQEANLHRMMTEIKGPEVPYTVIVDVGNPAQDIIAAAKKHDVDYIVMPTNGRRGLNRLIMGSTAERIIRTSPCPVYTDQFE